MNFNQAVPSPLHSDHGRLALHSMALILSLADGPSLNWKEKQTNDLSSSLDINPAHSHQNWEPTRAMINNIGFSSNMGTSTLTHQTNSSKISSFKSKPGADKARRFLSAWMPMKMFKNSPRSEG